jgi:ribosome biogenesis GTPase A
MPALDARQERARINNGPLLTELARRLQELAAPTNPDLSLEASRVADRLQQSCFHVVVLGEFKRGKSTLINALLGNDILPMGVLPLTAVGIQVSYGSSPPKVFYRNGTA